MDIAEENVTQMEILDKMSELEYSLCQQRDLNTEMRRCLDIADDDIAQLCSENAALIKQVKDLEKTISAAQQVEAEPCGSLMVSDLDVKRSSEKNIQRLEEESIMLKEQNKKLTSELKRLQQERELDKISLSKSKFAAQTFEQCMEEAQSGLQHMDEVIHQKNLKLQHLQETVEEYSNMIKELRLSNQELRKQLEETQNEAIFFTLNARIEKEEGLLTPTLSIAEEIKLLVSSSEAETSMSDSKHEEKDGEELLKPQSLTMDLQTKWYFSLIS